MTPIILASESPRRKQLLSEARVDFTVVSSASEEISDGFYPPHIPLINAILKAESVAFEHPDCLVIGADTVIELDDTILGKPSGLDDAKRMLSLFSDREHYVTTGCCLINLSRKVKCVFAEITKVFFKKLSNDDIDRYLELVDVLDKAGAYAIQEHGEIIIDRIEGPLDNVIGLPCAKLTKAISVCSD